MRCISPAARLPGTLGAQRSSEPLPANPARGVSVRSTTVQIVCRGALCPPSQWGTTAHLFFSFHIFQNLHLALPPADTRYDPARPVPPPRGGTPCELRCGLSVRGLRGALSQTPRTAHRGGGRCVIFAVGHQGFRGGREIYHVFSCC